MASLLLVPTSRRSQRGTTISRPASAAKTTTPTVRTDNLWKQEPVVKSNWDNTLVNPSDLLRDQPNHIFPNGLKHSLGYLNQPFGQPQASPPAWCRATVGYWALRSAVPVVHVEQPAVRQPAGTAVGAGVQFVEIVGQRGRRTNPTTRTTTSTSASSRPGRTKPYTRAGARLRGQSV